MCKHSHSILFILVQKCAMLLLVCNGLWSLNTRIKRFLALREKVLLQSMDMFQVQPHIMSMYVPLEATDFGVGHTSWIWRSTMLLKKHLSSV